MVQPALTSLAPLSLPLRCQEGRECLAWVDTYDPADLPALHAHLDFVVCLGGDGLLLHAAALLGPALPPLISFKLGSLGFLTTHRRASSRMHGWRPEGCVPCHRGRRCLPMCCRPRPCPRRPGPTPWWLLS